MEEDKDLAPETPEVAVGETTTRVVETLSWFSRGQRKIQEWQFRRKMRYPFFGNINQSSDVLEAAMPLDPEHQIEAARRYSLNAKDDPRMMEFLLSDGVCDEAKWILLDTIRPTIFYSGSSETTIRVLPRVLEGLSQENAQEWIFVLSDLRIIAFLSSSYVPTEAKQEMIQLIRNEVPQSSTDPIEGSESMNQLLEHWERELDLSFTHLARLHPDFDQWNQSVVPFLQNPEVPENVRASFLTNYRIQTKDFLILNREFVRNCPSSEFWEQLRRADLSDYKLQNIIKILNQEGLSPENFWEEAPKLNISKDLRYKVYCKVSSFDLDGVETEDFWNHVIALDLPDEVTLRIVEIVEDDSLKTTRQHWSEGGFMRNIILDSSISIDIRRALIPKLRHYEVTWEYVGDMIMDCSLDPMIRYELGQKVNHEHMMTGYGPALTEATGLIPLRNLPRDPDSRYVNRDYEEFTCLAAQILDGGLDDDAWEKLDEISMHDEASWDRLVIPLIESPKIEEERKIQVLQKIAYFDQKLGKHVEIINNPALAGSEKLQGYLIGQLNTFYFAKGGHAQVRSAWGGDVLSLANKKELVGIYKYLTFNRWGNVIFSTDFPMEVRVGIAKKIQHFDKEEIYIRPANADVPKDVIMAVFSGTFGRSVGESDPYAAAVMRLFQAELFDLEPWEEDSVDPSKLDENESMEAPFSGAVIHTLCKWQDTEEKDLGWAVENAGKALGLSGYRFIQIVNCYYRGESVDSFEQFDADFYKNWNDIRELAHNDPKGYHVDVVRKLVRGKPRMDEDGKSMEEIIDLYIEVASLPDSYSTALSFLFPFSLDGAVLRDSQIEAICVFLKSDVDVDSKRSFFNRFDSLPVIFLSFFDDIESDEVLEAISMRLLDLDYSEVECYVLRPDFSLQVKHNLIRKVVSIDIATAQLPRMPSAATIHSFLDNIILPPEEANKELAEEELYLLLVCALGRCSDSEPQQNLIRRLEFDGESYKQDLIAKVGELESVCFQQKDHEILRQVLNHSEATTLDGAFVDLTHKANELVKEGDPQERPRLESPVPLTVYFRLGHTINYGMAGEAMLRLFQQWTHESDVFSGLEIVPRSDDYAPLKSTRDLPGVQWRPISGDDFVNAVQKNDRGAVIYMSHSTPPEDYAVALVSSGTKNEEICSDEHLDLGLELEDSYLPGDEDNVLETMTFDELAVHLYPRFLELEKKTADHFLALSA